METLKNMYGWAFSPEKLIEGYVRPDARVIDGPFFYGDLKITPLPVEHAAVETIGFRFDHPHRRSLAYLPDVKRVPNDTMWQLRGVDVLVASDDAVPLALPVLLGVASDGVHSNGWSCVRKVGEISGVGWDAPAPFAEGALGAANAEGAAENPVKAIEICRKPVVGAINGETQSFNNSLEVAQRWFDRGEDYEACGYYQKALGSLRRLGTLYADLKRETGDSEYSAKSREMEDQEGVLLESYGDMCIEAERRLY